MRSQPPGSPLQTLGVVISTEHALTGLLDALIAAQPHCKVENLYCLLFGSSEFKLAELKEAQLGVLKHSLEHLGRRSRSLWLNYAIYHEEETTASAASQETTGEEENKGTDASYTAFMNCIVAPVVSQMVQQYSAASDISKLVEFQSGCIADSHELLSSVCAALQLQSCKLTRLNVRGGQPPLVQRRNIDWKPEMMAMLLQSVASPGCPIQDLGVPLGSPKLSYEDNKKCRSIFAHAFTSGPSLTKIKTLRLDDISTEERAACVAQVLGSGESSCQVRFLEVEIHSRRRHSQLSFFTKLQNVQARIQYVRIAQLDRNINTSVKEDFMSQLADFLRWENSLLLCLDCRCFPNSAAWNNEKLELQLANSLESNYLYSLSSSSLGQVKPPNLEPQHSWPGTVYTNPQGSPKKNV